MKNNTTILKYFFTTILFISLGLGKGALFGQLDVDFQEIEEYLRTANIVSATPDENAGRTEPWRIELDKDNLKLRGQFKHVSRCRPHPLPDCYKYEIAAYELSKLLGIGFVPPTVERQIEGITGSLQLLVEGCELLSNIIEKDLKLSDLDKFNNCMLDCRVFGYLVSFTSRDDDILVDLGDCTVCLVDFSEAFVPVHRLDPGVEVIQCSEELYNNLVRLSDHDVRSRLQPYLNEEELEALLVRKKMIIAKHRHTAESQTCSMLIM
jgi:hypothetical protein